jgi:hypothetical protein
MKIAGFDQFTFRKIQGGSNIIIIIIIIFINCDWVVTRWQYTQYTVHEDSTQTTQ